MHDANPARPTAVARELCRKARLAGKQQRATIWDVIMVARPGDRPRQVANTWRQERTWVDCEREYSDAFAESRRLSAIAHQQRLRSLADEAMAHLRLVSVQDDHAIVACLATLCSSTDWAGVTVDWGEVHSVLYQLGFRDGDRLGALATMNERTEVRWMAGFVMKAISEDPTELASLWNLLKLGEYGCKWLELNPIAKAAAHG